MTAESVEDTWIGNPLSVLRHSMNCLEGGSCQVAGCQDMRSSMGHSQNCNNTNCPAPPCIAMRQFTTEHVPPSPASPLPQLSLEQIFRCALAATDLKPTIERKKSSRGSSSGQCSSRSSTTSSFSSDDSVFRVPRGKPRRF